MMRRLGLTIVVCVLTGLPAWGQINDPGVQSQNIEPLPFSRPIAEWILAGGSLLAALAVGFYPSRRSPDA
jgi:hypothetical protein